MNSKRSLVFGGAPCRRRPKRGFGLLEDLLRAWVYGLHVLGSFVGCGHRSPVSAVVLSLVHEQAGPKLGGLEATEYVSRQGRRGSW